jgi:hypothetical protein
MKLNKAKLYSALQMSYAWDQASFELVDWQPGKSLDRDEFRMPDVDGDHASLAITRSTPWAEDEVVLATLWFKKRTANKGKFGLYMKLDPTAPVAYLEKTEEPVGVRLTGTRSVIEGLRNHPNPFTSMTTVYFNSVKNEDAQFTVYDVSGKIVYSKEIQLVSGENEFIVTKAELKGAGIYHYQIKSALQYSTNRMIIVE